MTTPSHLALLPRDGLFCKDGRGWHTSASGRGHALDWPWPSTILGALRSAWGRREEARRRSILKRDEWPALTAGIALGRTLVLRRPLGAAWSRDHRVWPVPGDSRWFGDDDHKHVLRLDPRPPRLPTLGIDDDDARERLWVPVIDEKSKPRAPPRWWREEHMVAWLADERALAHPPAGQLEITRRFQTHVTIQASTLTAAEGLLFSHDVIETLERNAEWAIGVEVEFGRAVDLSVATLGSDSRLARIEHLPPGIFEPPPNLLAAFKRGSRGLRLVVVSPTRFARGWLPDGLEAHDREYRGQVAGLNIDLVLRAALVPRPGHISGWDMHKNIAKETSRVVPPGAVYFFERRDGAPFGEPEARALWLATVGGRTREGFGRLVPGTWSPTPSAS